MPHDLDQVELVPDITISYLAKSVLLAALMAVLAQVSIQLPGGIPFSFQPFAVFFAGLILGPIWGAFSVLLYLVVGIAGAPVFSNGGAGIGYVLGPTGGFLIGFLFAAIVIGAIAHRSRYPRPLSSVSLPVISIALIAALIPMYVGGILWFAEIQGWTTIRAAMFMIPFLIGDLVKITIVIGIVAGNARLFDQLHDRNP